jgi:hypothetical protein
MSDKPPVAIAGSHFLPYSGKTLWISGLSVIVSNRTLNLSGIISGIRKNNNLIKNVFQL